MVRSVTFLNQIKLMNKNVNIAVIGLGQIGSYVLNELNTKKKDINDNDISKLNFDNEKSFDEFKKDVIKYGKLSDFPKLD